MLARSLIGLASPMRFRASLRPWILLLATLAWLWANSVFTPWAEDRAPRLWLYDLLFYLRFVLLFWGGGELLRLALRRGSRTDAVPLAATVLVVLVALGYQHSETGLRWKLAASSDALAATAHDGEPDCRQRTDERASTEPRRNPDGPASALVLAPRDPQIDKGERVHDPQ